MKKKSKSGVKLPFSGRKILRVLFITLLLLLIGSILLVYIVISKMQTIAVEILSQELNRPVSIGSMDIGLDGNFDISDFSIANPSWAQETDWLRIRRVKGRINLEKLLTRQFHFQSISIIEPFFYLEIHDTGLSNIPEPSQENDKGEKKSENSMSVIDFFTLLQADQITLTGGMFRLWMPDQNLELHSSSINMSAQLIDRSKLIYDSQIQLVDNHFTMKDDIDVRGVLRCERLLCSPEGVKLAGKPLILDVLNTTSFKAIKGTMSNYTHPILDCEISSQISLKDLRKSLNLPIVFDGKIILNGTLMGLADDLTINAAMDTDGQVRIWDLIFNRIESGVGYQNGSIFVEDLKAILAGGTINGKGNLAFLDETSFSVNAKLKDIEFRDIIETLGYSQPLSGAIGGEIVFEGTDYDFSHLQGGTKLNIAFDSNQKAKDSDIRADYFAAEMNFKMGNTSLSRCEALIQGTSVNFTSTMSNQSKLSGTYRIQINNANKLYQLLNKIKVTTDKKFSLSPKNISNLSTKKTKKRPFKKPEFLRGKGILEGSLSGTLSQPIIDCQLELTPFRIEKISFERITSQFSLSPVNLIVHDFQANQRDMRVRISGQLSLDTLSRLDNLELNKDVIRDLSKIEHALPTGSVNADIEGLRLHEVARFLPIEGDLDGNLNLNLSVENVKHFTGSTVCLVRNLNLFGEEIFQTQFNLNIKDNSIRISPMKLLFFDTDIGLSEVKGSCSLDYDGHFSFSVETERLNADLIKSFQKYDIPARGIISGKINGEGTLDDPEITGNFTLYDTSLADDNLGMGQAEFEFGRGKLLFNASLLEQGVEAKFVLDISKERIEEGSISINNTNFLPYLTLADLKLDSIVGRATGLVTLNGNYQSLENLVIHAQLSNFYGGLTDFVLTNTEPMVIDMEQGTLVINPVTLIGEETEIYLSGNIDFNKQMIQLGAEGTINMVLFSRLEPSIALSSGHVYIGTNVEGPFSNLYYYTEAWLENGFLVLQDIPLEFKESSASLVMNNRSIEINSFKATLGKGTVSIAGGFLLPHFDSSFDPFQTELDLSIGVDNSLIDYPEGFEATVDSTLNVRKTLAGPYISGSALLQSGYYEADINIRAMLIDILRQALLTRPTETSSPEEIIFNPSFNIVIKSEEPIRLISDDLNARFDTDLLLYGDMMNPKLQGNLEITEGDISFDDRVLSVTAGTISFVNPKGIYPSFDIQTESKIQGYTIYVNLTGEYPDFILTFNSDDNLPKERILALLLTGELNLQGGGTGISESFAYDLLLTNVLNNEIVNRVKDLFTIDKFQITPITSSTGGSRVSSVQITAGKEIAGWYVTYTKTPDEHLTNAKKNLSRRLSIEFMYLSGEKQLGGDLRFRFPFP